MARIAFSLTEAQIQALNAIGAGLATNVSTRGMQAGFDLRCLEELRRRGWIDFERYSGWSIKKLTLKKKGRAVYQLIRSLELHKAGQASGPEKGGP